MTYAAKDCNLTIRKTEGSIGLDPKIVDQLDWDLALKRVLHDMRSDFIWAPHFRHIFKNFGNQLVSELKSELKSGRFCPGFPITIDVPKTFRIKVGKRLGPSFSRPGSILLPKDRLLYQALADRVGPTLENILDHSRSFSHRLAYDNNDAMFLPTRTSWGKFQRYLTLTSLEDKYNYIMKLDIFNYFGSINQHTLINALSDKGISTEVVKIIEFLLLSYTGERNSRGLIQGIYPSDLFGAFYLHAIDQFFDDHNICSARYVDDIYLFIENVDAADRILKILIPELRMNDLSLNEVKSTIVPKSAIVTEEPDLDALFSEAIREISDQIEEDDTEYGYGFQRDWEEDDDDEDDDTDGADESDDDELDLELEATKRLFDSIDDFPGHEESIERFCLPLFMRSESDYAVNHVMDAVDRRPSMTQIYASYLGQFIEDKDVIEYLTDKIDDDTLFDWQRMWLLAALCQSKSAPGSLVRTAYRILTDATRHDALRAVAAIYVGRFGDITRRKSLFRICSEVSDYIQLAIYFSSRSWPIVERRNARTSWGGRTELNRLMSTRADG